VKPEIYFCAADAYQCLQFCRDLGYEPTAQFTGIVAYRVDENGLRHQMGMVGFDGWTRRSVMMHFQIPQPRCLMPLWNEALAYLAKHGRTVIVGSTPGDKERALRVIRKLGWKQIARIENGYDDGIDLVISEYRIDQHGQEQRSAA
jgi:hypothetical protein